MPTLTPRASTAHAVAAIRADHTALLALLDGCPPHLWSAPSGCAGWTVKDLVAHLLTMFWRTADPSRLPRRRGMPFEVGVAHDVADLRSWDATRVLDEYVTAVERALPMLEALEGVDDALPIGDLGTLPASQLPNGYAFDLYTHLRADLLAPRGPLEAEPPPSDELRMRPTVEWILAVLPQQNEATVAGLPGAVEFLLTGPGGGHFVLHPVGGFVTGDDARVDTVASITCTTVDLVWWSTGRASWAELDVHAAGDPDALTRLSERVHVF